MLWNCFWSLFLYTTYADDAEEVPQLRCAIDKHFKELYETVRLYDVKKRLGFVLLPALARQLTPHIHAAIHHPNNLTS